MKRYSILSGVAALVCAAGLTCVCAGGRAVGAAPLPVEASARGPYSVMPQSTDSPQPDIARQVRIDQRLSIRISPGSAVLPPGVIIELEQQERATRTVERRIGPCVPVNMIAGVQSGKGNQLILFLRDNHVVAATLEKACRAQDFYSGFYLSRNTDGQVCVNRDKLQSRSGANCAIRQWRGIVDAPARRFP